MDNIFTNILGQLQGAWGYLSSAASAFWQSVVLPFGSTVCDWSGEYLLWIPKVLDFVSNLFKLRFKIRVYSFTLLLPIACLALVLALFMRRKHRRAKK